MSNAESSSDQPLCPVDDLASSSTQPTTDVPIISQSNVSDQVTTQTDAPVKKTTPEPDSQPSATNNDFHLLKWIDFNFERLPILLQNVNGPCPLLAIFNILLLRKRVSHRALFSATRSSFSSEQIVLKPHMDAVSTQHVVSMLADHILDSDTSVSPPLVSLETSSRLQKLSDEDRANYECNVQDALAVLDKLKTGLDVNLKFDG